MIYQKITEDNVIIFVWLSQYVNENNFIKH